MWGTYSRHDQLLQATWLSCTSLTQSNAFLCNCSGRVRVRYFKSENAERKGAAATLFTSVDRWIEVCAPYPWGHRQDKTHVDFSTASGSCAHICWEDVNDCVSCGIACGLDGSAKPPWMSRAVWCVAGCQHVPGRRNFRQLISPSHTRPCMSYSVTTALLP